MQKNFAITRENKLELLEWKHWSFRYRHAVLLWRPSRLHGTPPPIVSVAVVELVTVFPKGRLHQRDLINFNQSHIMLLTDLADRIYNTQACQ